MGLTVGFGVSLERATASASLALKGALPRAMPFLPLTDGLRPEGDSTPLLNKPTIRVSAWDGLTVMLLTVNGPKFDLAEAILN